MFNTDFLVIGSGIAGLIYALEVAEHGEVTVLCKGPPTEGSTQYAQGGIASVTSPLDSFRSHIEDTVAAGDGLCNRERVELLVTEGPAQIQKLIDLGTHFDKESQSNDYELAKEGGHSARRILHAGDATGAEIQRAIYERARTHKNIRILPYQIAIDFILGGEDSQEVYGAYALETTSGKITSFGARVTMLATGGVGKVYLYTSNPVVATGDGIAMAYRAGAAVSNMEFIQFHPTCLYHPKANSFLITEAMRGEGAKLLLQSGEPFMHYYHPQAELASRDIVARAIDDQLKKTGDDYVLLDITKKDPEFIKTRFPTIYQRLLKLGIDITVDRIPVVPAAHYCCGGVRSDEFGRTNLKRLYTAGETACTGVHGANRLASNSLLEALVFSNRAAVHTIENLDKHPKAKTIPEWDYLDTVKSSEEVLVSHSWDEIRRLMWNLVGIVRNTRRLHQAQRRVELITKEISEYYWRFNVTSDLIELRNIIEIADLIIRSALERKESRGLHYTLDYPERGGDDFLAETILIRKTSENPNAETT